MSFFTKEKYDALEVGESFTFPILIASNGRPVSMPRHRTSLMNQALKPKRFKVSAKSGVDFGTVERIA